MERLLLAGLLQSVKWIMAGLNDPRFQRVAFRATRYATKSLIKAAGRRLSTAKLNLSTHKGWYVN